MGAMAQPWNTWGFMAAIDLCTYGRRQTCKPRSQQWKGMGTPLKTKMTGWKISMFNRKYGNIFKWSIFQLLVYWKWERLFGSILCSNYTLHLFDFILWMANVMARDPHTMAIHLVIPELSGCNRKTVQNFPPSSCLWKMLSSTGDSETPIFRVCVVFIRLYQIYFNIAWGMRMAGNIRQPMAKISITNRAAWIALRTQLL